MSDEDEWEQAGLNLDKLQIKTDPEIKPAFLLPQRGSMGPGQADIASEINFMRDLPQQGGAEAAGLVGNDEPITDSVLIDAANNPRERMHVLSLENFILEFVKSGDRSVEMPTVSNSFRRLLIYRLASRFRVVTESAQYPNEYGEKGVIAFRTPDSCIPTHLLINYKPSGGYDEYDHPPLHDTSSSSSSSNNNNSSSSSTKKVLVMRRVPSASDNSKKDSASQRNQQSELDKERAYAEARARIFGEATAAGEDPLSHHIQGVFERLTQRKKRQHLSFRIDRVTSDSLQRK